MSSKQDAAGCGFILLIIFGAIGWMIYVEILASYPSKEDPDCDHTPGCQNVLRACTATFHTDNVLLKQRKGDNLSVYVDQHKFEDIPFPERDTMLKPIVEDWCQYHGGPLLPYLWFVDIRTG